MEGEVGVISPATAFTSPSSWISSGSERHGGRGFNSLIGESPEMLFKPSSSRASSVGGGACFGSLIPVSMQFSSPLSCVSAEGGGSGFGSLLRVTPGRGRESREVERFLRALRELSERYDDCFLRLRYATAEIAGLRRERLRLAAENLHLSLLLDDLEAAPNKQGLEAAPAPPVSSVATEETRGGVPKSISIRSKSFLSPPPPADEDKMQRLRVRVSPATEKTGEKGGEEERDKEAEVEVEAYRQGAEKTELCNKWERGACPYGDRCRFAHGLQELRPVIRHPRYKTLPCYMFTASGCPYGHRCHFRHSPPPTA